MNRKHQELFSNIKSYAWDGTITIIFLVALYAFARYEILHLLAR